MFPSCVTKETGGVSAFVNHYIQGGSGGLAICARYPSRHEGMVCAANVTTLAMKLLSRVTKQQLSFIDQDKRPILWLGTELPNHAARLQGGWPARRSSNST
jgi:hypothetical protein